MAASSLTGMRAKLPEIYDAGFLEAGLHLAADAPHHLEVVQLTGRLAALLLLGRETRRRPGVFPRRRLRDSVDHVHAQVGEGRDVGRLRTVREHHS